jgi:ABC-type lipoprotein release transport system permease subunit
LVGARLVCEIGGNMRVVFMRAGTNLRSRVRSSCLLIVAIAIAGGATIAALAGARRTDTAVDRFVAYEKPQQGGVQADVALYPDIRRLPEVESSAELTRFGFLPIDGNGRPETDSNLGAIGVDSFGSGRPLVVAGRMPRVDRIDEVAVNASATRNEHLGIGSVIRFRSYTPGQAQAILGPNALLPNGPVITVHVVGIVRFPTDLSTAQITPGVTYTGSDTAFFTPAFLTKYRDRVALLGGLFLTFRLHDPSASLAAFRAHVARITQGHGQVFVGSDDLDAAAQARHATSVEALALLLFGGLAGIVTLALIGQAFGRTVHLGAEDDDSLSAMGITRRQLVAAVVLTVAVISVIGAVLAVAVAILASPLMPIGLARQAEVHRGISIDAPVLVAGGFLIVLVLVAWATLVAWRATRPVRDAGGPARQRSRVASMLRQAGWPPVATMGTTMTFEPGGGVEAVPVRTALVSAVIAVVVVAGALTFGANLSRLAGHPRLQGWNWDVAVGNPHSDDISKVAIPKLVHDSNIDAVASIANAEAAVGARLDNHSGWVFGIDALEGAGLIPYTEGRAPASPDEIALGARTMHDLRVHVGDRIRVTTGRAPRSMLITGRLLLTPSVVNDSLPLGQGAVVTTAALHALGTDAPVNEFLVRFAPGVDRATEMARLQSEFPGTVLPAVRPPDIENLRRVDHLPAILAGLFALIALLTVGNTLVNTVSRRRHDVAVLRTLGFLKGQVSAMVAWQATTFAVLSVVLGLPIGAAIGRVAWTLVTDRLGLPADAVIPGLQLLFVAVTALVLVNVIAVFPRVLATRRPPAAVLHTE